MSALETIREALNELSWHQEEKRGVWIATQCLYPSNASVKVLVQGESDRFIVTDDGGAVDEIASAGFSFEEADKRLRTLAGRQGLTVIGGAIISPKVPLPSLAAAILLVANLSKEAAHWGVSHLKIPTSANFREELDRIIHSFQTAEIHRSGRFVGASNKEHAFEYVLRPGKQRLLLIDPVFNDRSSINAKALAHLDVRNVGNDNLEQRLVYDDRVPWDAADLNLLGVGATVVPLSHFQGVLERLVA